MQKIMIVDNEAAIRKGLIHCISWTGLHCTIAAQAEDGLDALEQIPVVKPDIVISDIRMPGMDGLELAKELHTNYPWIKVIILTGFPDFEYAKQAISYQVVDFVLKPTSVESLTNAIEKAKARIAQEDAGHKLMKELENKEEQNLTLQQELFLHDLIRGVTMSQIFLLNRCARLKIDMTSYFALRLDIALLEEQQPLTEEEEKRLTKHLQQVKTLLIDCLSECNVYFVPRGNQICYAIVNAPDSYPLIRQCTETIHILNSLPQFFLSIGISRHFDNPLHLPKATEQADQAAQFARYSPDVPITSYEQLPEIPKESMERIFSDLSLLKAAIETQNHKGTRDILVKLFTFIRENKLPVDTVRTICLYIHQFCISLLFLPHLAGTLTEGSIPVLKKLIESESIDTMEQNMLLFVEQILSQTIAPDDQTDQLILSVKTYITQHYADDISLDNIANQVHLSPSYLSRLFKKKTGENLSSYIQTMRIEQAKTLLRTTTLKTYEVGERVGISDPVYFSRIFKKLTGTKPKDYRHEYDSSC